MSARVCRFLRVAQPPPAVAAPASAFGHSSWTASALRRRFYWSTNGGNGSNRPEQDPPAPDDPETPRPKVWLNKEKDEIVVKELLGRNEVWRDGALQWDPNAFKNNAEHHPRFLIVGCSDARVPIERVFGMQPGEAFVHRNVGNLVVGTDLNFLSVLQYAVDVLQVEHILVCGHYECGACRAAVRPQDLGLIENWLRNIRDVYRLNHRELQRLGDPSSEEFHRRLVELNVREQCINLFKTSTVQQNRTKFGFPSIHGFVYDINSGKMLHQDAQLYDYIRRYKHIYRLYQ